jgi:putative transposase
MRCVKRQSQTLTARKARLLDEVVSAYAAEKDYHLRWLTPERFTALSGERERRDELVRQGYKSPYGLQARMWKQAWKDAYETVDKYLAALAEEARPVLWCKARHAGGCAKDRNAHAKDCPECKARLQAGKPCRHWTDAMTHYAWWCLASRRLVAALVARRVPAPIHFAIPDSEQRAVARVLGHELRQRMGRWPRAHKARSACFDANMYHFIEGEGGRQWVALMGLEPNNRTVVPLKGQSTVPGTIRVVKGPGARVCAVHVSHDLHVVPAEGEGRGIDLGQSEVLTDDHGKRYGEGFGKFLAKASQVDKDKGQKRGKLHAIRKKAIAKDDKAKARRTRRNNLGYKKLDERRRRDQEECKRQVNAAFRELFQLRDPSSFGMERLDFRGPAKSKEMSRRTAQVRMSSINERSAFLASVAGSHREKVNPAYGSQACPRCGYVQPKNRNGDRFVCLHCKWAGHADRVGAYHYRNRMHDPEVHLFTPKVQVWRILRRRFSEATGLPADWEPAGATLGDAPDWKPDAEAS